MPAIRHPLPRHEVMVEHIVKAFTSASPEQVTQGLGWYPSAERIVRIIAEATERDPHRVAHVVSALSPRNPWRWNVADAYSYCLASREGHEAPPSATTFHRNRRAAWRALHDAGQPWVTSAPKVRAFVAAILGDDQAVVVDTWAIRVASGGVADYVGGDARYAAIEAAYRDAARALNVAPRDVQAVTWLVAQQAGLASRRTGRHDLAFKRDTPEWLRQELVA